MPTKSWLPQGHRNYFIDGYISEETLIDHCLLLLAGKPVIEQLKQRKIKFIRKSSGVGGKDGWFGSIFPIDGAFTITVNFDNSLKECAKTIGHELGHTFSSYYIDDNPTRVTYNKPQRMHVPSEKKEEEFCENFMKRWLEQGANRAELESLLDAFFKGESSELVIF